MPVVEPYAISQPLSTAGKVNMNYEILPFTYITRATALYGVLKNEKLMAVPTSPISAASTYKSSTNTIDFRLTLNVPATLEQFKDRFTSGKLFLSASEICQLYLVPTGGETVSTMPTFWNSHRLTGENVREGLYGRIYPRLTTKSNTCTVHFVIQSLRQSKTATAGEWREDTGHLVGESRGSTTIERYIDPKDSLPDFRSDLGATPQLDSAYRWRIVGAKRFSP